LQHTKTRRLAAGIKKIAMRLGLPLGLMFAVALLMGCGSSGDTSPSADQEADAGPTAASLEAMSVQVSLGEPPLEGNIVLKFQSH
jgi:hypothetical protein